MYIGGVDATGLHHLLWESSTTPVDEAMNGYADRITVVLQQGRRFDDRDRQRARHPRRPPRAVQEAGAGADPHDAPRGWQVRGEETTTTRAASTGRRGVGGHGALREAHGGVKRDGFEWEQTFSRGKATGPLKKIGAARAAARRSFFRPDPKIFPDVRFD